MWGVLCRITCAIPILQADIPDKATGGWWDRSVQRHWEWIGEECTAGEGVEGIVTIGTAGEPETPGYKGPQNTEMNSGFERATGHGTRWQG